MKAITVVEGRMAPLDRADIDTDQIMPKQFLKRIERTGFGEYVFHDWRADGDFVLNDPRYADAKVLVTGPNFGSGSSREHAPWGLQEYGFDAIVAPSFADIFRTNCAKNALLTVTLPATTCEQLVVMAQADPEAVCRIDLRHQELVAWSGDGGPRCQPSPPDLQAEFEIDQRDRRCLLEGLDDIALTLQDAAAIDAFERRRPTHLPIATAATSPGG